MKKIHIYIISLLVAFASVGCTDEVVQTKESYGEIGDEVQFGLSLNGLSRTIYGPEENNAFPIYWVNGDKVTVYSPQCLEGKKNAEYKVTVPEGRKQNYATSLDKIGANGVQWGNEDANFYSLYPSGQYTLSKDGKLAQNVKIGYSQDVLLVGNGPELKNMTDCLMFAKAENVPVGETVNLNYKPLATAIMITLSVDAASAEDFVIQAVNVTAPTVNDQPVNIVGEFNVDIATGGFVDWVQDAAGKVKASNTVKLQLSDHATGAFPTIYNNASKGATSLTIPVFIAPRTGLTIEGWKFEIVTNKGAFTKTIKDKDAIKAGMVHKLTLPKLSVTATTDEWDVSNWMVNIPRNVYLSEVSIPGSWNTINSDYQSNTTIDGQYAVGVRAFHLDTRWRTNTTSEIFGYVGGTINGLSVAGSAESAKYTQGDRVVKGNGKTFAEYLKQITDNIIDESGNPKQEYMVVMCTFAQDSYNYTDANGKNWVDAISDACAANSYVYDAKNLNSYTVVGDVIGKVIVIVNMEGAVTTVPSGSKCLFVDMPLTLTSNLFGSELNDNNKGLIYKGSANTTAAASDIEMYHTQAQISIAGDTYTGTNDRSNVMGRGFAPTFGERKTVANNILDWSKNNYGTENYQHNKWIYLGLGGYYSHLSSGSWVETKGSNATVASNFNTWINGKVTEMATIPEGATAKIPYYPVGIVLMNLTNDYTTAVKNILTLNQKYRLQFNEDLPADYNPNARQAREYNAVMLNGGAVFQ